MSEERRKRPSVVRRTKKNGNRAQNKELRQSVHEIQNKELRQSVNEIIDEIGDLNIEQSERRPSGPTKLKRSNSVSRDLQTYSGEPKNSREILKQYVANTHNIDINDLNATDQNETKQNIINSGELPLHEIIDRNSIKDLALYLMKNEDAQIEQKNSAGQTPLIYAVCLGDAEVVNLLVTFGGSVNVCDNFGVTALRYAVESGDFEIASLLISHGANADTVQDGF